MSWLREVFHVAGKDARFARWWLVAYGLAVAGVTAWVATGGWADWDVLPPLGLILMGLLLVAILVQVDSPARSDAFWTTRPLRPSAVFGAKVLVVLVLVVGVGLLGQTVALLAWAVPVRELIVVLGESAGSYGGVLAFGLLVAGLTRDIRTFALALILLFVIGQLSTLVLLALIGPEALSRRPFAPSMFPHGLYEALGMAGLLAVLAHQYVTRDRRRSVSLGVAWWVVWTGIGILGPAPASVEAGAPGPPPGELREPTLVIDSPRAQGDDDHYFPVGLGNTDPRHRYTLISAAVRVREADGTQSVIPIRPPDHLTLTEPGVRAFELDRPGSGRAAPSESRRTLRLPLSRDHIERARRGETQLVLEGRLAVSEAVRVARLPLEPGFQVRRSGWRIRLGQIDTSRSPVQLSVEISLVGSQGRVAERSPTFALFGEAMEVALVNPDLGEGIRLRSRLGGTHSGLLVIPGAAVRRVRHTYEPTPVQIEGQEVDQEWFSDAHLVIAEWKPLGSYPVQSHIVVR